MHLVVAQDYKASTIDASGKVYDKDGKHIGSVNKQGEIRDVMNMKIAYIEGSGMLIDAKSGKILGKAEKNGNYFLYFSKLSDMKIKFGLIVGLPEMGSLIF